MTSAASSDAAPVPASNATAGGLILLDSAEGLKLDSESREAKTSQFAEMQKHFRKQWHNAFCGIATSCTVLQHLHSAHGTPKSFQEMRVFPLPGGTSEWRTLTWEHAAANGLTLEETGSLLRALGAEVQIVHSDKCSLDGFRQLAVKTLTDGSRQCLAINFLSAQLGCGHHSPVAAYHAGSDRFLVLDVWKTTPHAWISARELWAALNTVDKDANAHRGFLIVGLAGRSDAAKSGSEAKADRLLSSGNKQLIMELLSQLYRDVSIESIADSSKGVDNRVLRVTFSSTGAVSADSSTSAAKSADSKLGDKADTDAKRSQHTVIVRQPHPAGLEAHPHHSIAHQSWATRQWGKTGARVPAVLLVDQERGCMIESFVGERDFSEVAPQLSASDRAKLLRSLGAEVRRAHDGAKALGKFAYMSAVPGIGRFDNWSEMFGSFSNDAANLVEKGRVTSEQAAELAKLHESMGEYLRAFKEQDCRVVHCDLLPVNIRVQRAVSAATESDAKASASWELAAIIDFGDAISGDPLLDLGTTLSDLNGDWSQFASLEEGYGALTPAQREVVRFYALTHVIFLLDFPFEGVSSKLDELKTRLSRLLVPTAAGAQK